MFGCRGRPDEELELRKTLALAMVVGTDGSERSAGFDRSIHSRIGCYQVLEEGVHGPVSVPPKTAARFFRRTDIKVRALG